MITSEIDNKSKPTLTIQAQYSNKEIITTEDVNKQAFILDTMNLSKWTDFYVPFKTSEQRHYTANLYSTQPRVNNYNIISIYSNGDHWNKIHLVSLSEDLKLIDKIEVANSLSTLNEQTEDTEIVGHDKSYSKMISSDEYLNFIIYTTEIIDYIKDTTVYETDSITNKITIDKTGRFLLTKLDSARKDYAP